ncbi:Protein CBG01248 [Caenorhabditis briggsae]|uniref:Nuclear Hormone Receptor family n=2 Tax=Caenorhabditis briggsae TaxID=6238 RepID=A0AAE9JII5_CAEBR|nr:Protein CBG01248 [Caenorhabditis briggsae]UMM33185.1 hypothetical protein L5515_006755 [Caenorhabditis briggsae]CAP22540.1 Protein CBG01248 [Caenorhabditis briggsae]
MPPALHISGLCEVCDQPAFGKHFGVLSCRACAAFFRRSGNWLKQKKCDKENCKIFEESYKCKICRLKKCYKVGMDVSKFQKNRDLLSNSSNYSQRSKIATPQSLANFLGRPEFILCFEPDRASSTKTIIDVSYLLEKVSRIFQHDPSYLGPYEIKSSLERVTYAMEAMKSKKINNTLEVCKVIGKREALLFWELTFIGSAHWLAEFEEFRNLEMDVKLDIQKSVWTIWMRLAALAETSAYNRMNVLKSEEEENGLFVCSGGARVNMKEIKMDLSWCTNYSTEEIARFMGPDVGANWNSLLDDLTKLNPTNTELNYMLLHICLHDAGKKYQGKVLEATEKLLGILADNLHAYYLNKMRMTNYSGRIAQMMKINRMIEVELRDRREKNYLANLFDVYKIEWSHPEMFELI